MKVVAENALFDVTVCACMFFFLLILLAREVCDSLYFNDLIDQYIGGVFSGIKV